MSLFSIISQLARRRGGSSSDVDPGPGDGVEPPSSFSANGTGGFNAALTWGASPTSGVTYVVQKSFTGDFSDAETLYTGSGLSVDDDKAVIDGTCHYRIKATKAGEDSSYLTDGATNSLPSDGTTGEQVDIFGDSITAGVGGTDINYGYAQIIQAALGGRVIGLGGFTITPNPVYNQWDPVTGNGQPLWVMPSKTNAQRLCFLAYGINDIGSAASVTASDYQAAIEDFIDTAVTLKGWTAERIVILGPFRGTGTAYASGGGTITTGRREAFRDAARAAAIAKGAAFYSNYDWQVSVGMTPADGLHPTTDEDEEQIAENLLKHIG